MEELTLEESLQTVWNAVYEKHVFELGWCPKTCVKCASLLKMAKLFPISLAEQLDNLKESGRI